jgi:4a-hydroxytetrahydrobiopterin dehydratase
MPTLIPESELSARLESIPGWKLEDRAIVRTFEHRDFVEAMAFVNSVAGAAEDANHHPDIDIRWNKVRLSLSTHSAGGLTSFDFDLAAKINTLA